MRLSTATCLVFFNISYCNLHLLEGSLKLICILRIIQSLQQVCPYIPKFKSMKNKRLLHFLLIGMIGFLSSCSVSNYSMKYPNYRIEFYKADFEYSQQLMAEATSVRILGIDWQRLLNWESGQIDSDRFDDGTQNTVISAHIFADPIVGVISTVVPVLGDRGRGRVSSYALYNLMRNNPGYDIVIYPQYETKRYIIPIFYSKSTVKVTARLGRINP